jgi:hypothetical protein
MLPLGSTPFQVRLLALASFLAQLQDQLPGMVRDDCVVVLQDDTFQLERPFPLLFQIPGLTKKNPVKNGSAGWKLVKNSPPECTDCADC